MEKQSYNVGRRECGRCGFLIHIMYPEYGETGSDEWYENQNKYMDGYIESCGWLIDLEHNRYLCFKCRREEEK